jgi:hypothetical protein
MHRQYESFNKTKQYLDVKMSSLHNSKINIEEDPNSNDNADNKVENKYSYRHTEQSNDNTNFQLEQLNISKLKGLADDKD